MPPDSEYEWYELGMDWSKTAGLRFIMALVQVWGKINAVMKTHWPSGEIASVIFIIGIPQGRKDEFLTAAALSKYASFRPAARVHLNCEEDGDAD